MKEKFIFTKKKKKDNILSIIKTLKLPRSEISILEYAFGLKTL